MVPTANWFQCSLCKFPFPVEYLMQFSLAEDDASKSVPLGSIRLTAWHWSSVRWLSEMWSNYDELFHLLSTCWDFDWLRCWNVEQDVQNESMWENWYIFPKSDASAVDYRVNEFKLRKRWCSLVTVNGTSCIIVSQDVLTAPSVPKIESLTEPARRGSWASICEIVGIVLTCTEWPVQWRTFALLCTIHHKYVCCSYRCSLHRGQLVKTDGGRFGWSKQVTEKLGPNYSDITSLILDSGLGANYDRYERVRVCVLPWSNFRKYVNCEIASRWVG